jgi:hypothetical protein
MYLRAGAGHVVGPWSGIRCRVVKKAVQVYMYCGFPSPGRSRKEDSESCDQGKSPTGGPLFPQSALEGMSREPGQKWGTLGQCATQTLGRRKQILVSPA